MCVYIYACVRVMRPTDARRGKREISPARPRGLRRKKRERRERERRVDTARRGATNQLFRTNYEWYIRRARLIYAHGSLVPLSLPLSFPLAFRWETSRAFAVCWLVCMCMSECIGTATVCGSWTTGSQGRKSARSGRYLRTTKTEAAVTFFF